MLADEGWLKKFQPGRSQNLRCPTSNLRICGPFHSAPVFHVSVNMKLDARTIERVEEASREIAILFIALAPLDVFLGEDPAHAAANGFVFVALGASLFVAALYAERKRLNVSRP